MAVVNITVTVTDTDGQSAVATGSATSDAVTIISSAMTSQVAPPNTLRTFGVVAQSSGGLSMTAAATTDQGASFVVTQVPNPTPPAGVMLSAGQQYFAFTFTL